MIKLKIFICGQKYPALELFRMAITLGHQVTGVCAPKEDKYLRPIAERLGIKVIDQEQLRPKDLEGCDIGLLINFFKKLPGEVVETPKYGFAGFHPSLLPRHRGRSSIEWALAMQDKITGGTIYWLNGIYDGGGIAYQRHILIPPQYFMVPIKEGAFALWKDKLLQLGIDLFVALLNDLSRGVVISHSQDESCATYEPAYK